MTKKVFTTPEFAKIFQFSEEYIRQCCRGQVNSKTGKLLQLPKGFSAKKVARDWLISGSARSIEQLRKQRSVE